MNATDTFLAQATPERRDAVKDLLAATGWEERQQAFLDTIGAYARAEREQGPDHLIAFHEAGGQWRIVFPHLRVRPDAETEAHLAQVMDARQRYADAHYHRGFPDECEVHHDVETFLYFQIPLFHLGRAGADAALASIRAVADHCLNRHNDVPPWYDPKTEGFVSTWLGTRSVRDRPPFDYQEANHFRFVDLCTTAYVGTGAAAYLDRATAYADRWCAHIESQPPGAPVPCQILPPGAQVEELGKAGAATREDVYQIFYATMAANTAYDVAMALLDLYILTRTARYLESFRRMVDPFFAHARGGRPATAFSNGAWQHRDPGAAGELRHSVSQVPAFLTRLARKHDSLTGEARYRDALLAWAQAIDEKAYAIDQSACDALVAAHRYTGETGWLARAYAMGLRVLAVCEENQGRHGGDGTNCNATTRYGSKFLLESLYAPLLDACDWGTRGNLPVETCRAILDGTAAPPLG